MSAQPTSVRQVLLLSATIPPGATARLIARPRQAFRAERLLVSPSSFPLPLARRAWTWPLVAVGGVLGRVYRGLARLLHVDLYAAHERREYVSAEYAQAHAEEVVSWDEDEESEGEGCPFVLVPAPLSRRERLLAPLGRAGSRLSRLRLDWQQAQLSGVFVCGIAISGQSQLVDGASPLPADIFASPSIDAFMNFASCTVGNSIEVEVHNGNRRECRLVMSLIGIAQ